MLLASYNPNAFGLQSAFIARQSGKYSLAGLSSRCVLRARNWGKRGYPEEDLPEAGAVEAREAVGRRGNPGLRPGLTLKARRDLSDSLHALQVFDFTHVFIPKPVPTFGRHALTPCFWTGSRAIAKRPIYL
jgi:hypothetical protein